MKYVLDASIALKWVLPEPDSMHAISLRDAYLNGVHELIAPDIFSVEIAYVLAKTFHRGLLTADETSQSLADVLLVAPVLLPSQQLLTRALEIAMLRRISHYDCLYVALAEHEQCELVTADQRLINAQSPDISFIVDLASVP